MRKKDAFQLYRKDCPDDFRVIELGPFASALDHDLRNPLGVMKACTYNLRKKLSDRPELIRHIDNMDEKIDQSEKILRGLQKFFCKSIQFETVDLRSLADETIKIFSNSDLAEIIKFSVEPEDLSSGEVIIKGSRQLLAEMFTCLVENSCESMRSGTRGEVKIELKTEPEKGRCSVTVGDNGNGMPKEVLRRVREDLFYSTKEGPYGLGLAFVRYVSRMHGGRVYFESEVSKGACAVVDLPLS